MFQNFKIFAHVLPLKILHLGLFALMIFYLPDLLPLIKKVRQSVKVADISLNRLVDRFVITILGYFQLSWSFDWFISQLHLAEPFIFPSLKER